MLESATLEIDYSNRCLNIQSWPGLIRCEALTTSFSLRFDEVENFSVRGTNMKCGERMWEAIAKKRNGVVVVLPKLDTPENVAEWTVNLHKLVFPERPTLKPRGVLADAGYGWYTPSRGQDCARDNPDNFL